MDNQQYYPATAANFGENFELLEVSLIAYHGPGYDIYPLWLETGRTYESEQTHYRVPIQQILHVRYVVDVSLDTLEQRYLTRPDVDAKWVYEALEQGDEHTLTFLKDRLEGKYQ